MLLFLEYVDHAFVSLVRMQSKAYHVREHSLSLGGDMFVNNRENNFFHCDHISCGLVEQYIGSKFWYAATSLRKLSQYNLGKLQGYNIMPTWSSVDG